MKNSNTPLLRGWRFFYAVALSKCSDGRKTCFFLLGGELRGNLFIRHCKNRQICRAGHRQLLSGRVTPTSGSFETQAFSFSVCRFVYEVRSVSDAFCFLCAINRSQSLGATIARHVAEKTDLQRSRDIGERLWRLSARVFLVHGEVVVFLPDAMTCDPLGAEKKKADQGPPSI